MPFLFRRPIDSHVTCRGRNDGGGAQISACISTMIFARLRGLHYAHSPVTEVAHAPEGMPVAEWSRQWEEFFSLGHGETPATEIEARLPVVTVPKAHRFRPRSRRLQVVAHCHKISNHHPEAWAAIAPELRRKYSLSPKPELPDEPGRRLAVHLRRGDVSREGRFAERFSETGRVVAAVRTILDAAGPLRLEVHSQGDPADFKPLTDLGAELFLDTDAFESFHRLVTADIRITAKSTFSYLAAVIGGGFTLYEPFWHPKLAGWLDLDELGAMPGDALRRRLLS